MNLSEAITEYLRLRKNRLAASTYRDIQSELRQFLTTVGDRKVANLTVDHLENYFYGDTGRATTVQAATFNNCRANVLGFTRWLMDEGHTRQDLMRRIQRKKAYQRERQRLTPQQMQAAIDSCAHPRDRVAIAIACNTGMRASSAQVLRVKDVDLDRGEIQYINVKLRRERTLPITADLDQELRTWFAWYQQECGPLQDDWYLIPARPRGGRGPCKVVPDKPAARARRIAHNALQGAGVDATGEGFHTFRRSAARAVFESALEAGDPRAIHITQAFLDHADAAMTARYIGTSHERQKLDDLLRGKKFINKTPEETANVVVVDFTRRRNGSV